jgi:hypothetical protein
VPDLHLVEHGNGDYSIGAEIEGVYVPFASVDAARVKHLQERAATIEERYDAGDDEEKKRLDEATALLPTSASSKSSAKSKTKGEGESA